MPATSLPPAAFAAGLIGGVLPDIDMLWFHFIASCQHHHELITDRPILWAGLGFVGLCLYRLSHHLAPLILLCVSLGAVLHLALDSIAGKVWWFWPSSDNALTLAHVQPTHDHWVLSFLHHWTFKVEIAVTLAAIMVFFIRLRRQKTARL